MYVAYNVHYIVLVLSVFNNTRMNTVAQMGPLQSYTKAD